MRLSPTLLILGLGLATTLLHAQNLTLKEGEKGLRVEIDGQLFTEYVTKDVPRPFFYPIIGASGENLVRNFPMSTEFADEPKDHKHHRGLWFAHGAVNGIDFWSEEKDFGRQEHTAFSEVKAEGSKGSFTATTKWVTADGKPVMTDTRRITITALPDGEKTIDFDITLQASEGEVVLGDTKEGTMAIRLRPQFEFKDDKSKASAYNAENVRRKAVWGKRSPWMVYHAPDAKGNVDGVVIFEHPKSFRSPTYWHARDYSLFAANPFGVHDFEAKKDQPTLGEHKMAKGESVNLRYRFLFAKGKPGPGATSARFDQYKAE